MAINAFSLARDGSTALAPHFRVREFRCKDGSDPVFIDSALVELLERIREHFSKPVTITSAYRTPEHNAESLMPDWGGVGRYPVKAGRATGWVHVDTRATKSRWTL